MFQHIHVLQKHKCYFGHITQLLATESVLDHTEFFHHSDIFQKTSQLSALCVSQCVLTADCLKKKHSFSKYVTFEGNYNEKNVMFHFVLFFFYCWRGLYQSQIT